VSNKYEENGLAIEIVDTEIEKVVIEIFRHDDRKQFTMWVEEGTPYYLVLKVMKEAEDDSFFQAFVD
jgi:hypothetical protein